MADLTPSENSLLGNLRLYKENIVFVPTASILEGVDYCRTLAKTIPTNWKLQFQTQWLRPHY